MVNNEFFRYFKKTIKKNPDIANKYFEDSKFCSRNNNLKRALKCINKAIKYSPENEIFYIMKIYYLLRMKKYKRALKPIESLIELSPENLTNYREKADILMDHLKDYNEALKVIDRGLLIDPKDSDLLNKKMQALIKLGRLEDILELISYDRVPVDQPDFHIYI